MNIEEFRDFCLNLPHVSESFPFDELTLVFKVGGKMFALTGLEYAELSVNLKCDPVKAIELRETYEAVQPGYHMNKKHWNTVKPNDGMPIELFKELILHSYELVKNSLTKKVKTELGFI